MKKTTKISLGALGLTTLLISSAFTFKNNGDPIVGLFCGSEKSSGGITGRTQSPHDLVSNSLSCEDCHGGGSTTPSITLTPTPAFGQGNTYVPGTTYTISYKVTGYSKFGFDLEIDNGNLSSSTALGTLTAGTNCRVSSSEVLHTTPISSSSTATFTWKAPSSGTAYLYSTGLGVNGTGGTSGDKQAFYNLVLTPQAVNTTGIEEVSINNEFKLFQNPAKDVATVNYYISKDTHVTIIITDLNGKIVSTQLNEEAAEGSYSKKLELSDLNTGTYFVKIKSNDHTVAKKLVIQ